MNFLRRLKAKENIPTPTSPRIKFNWQTWMPPLTILLINILLVWPLVKEITVNSWQKNAILFAYILSPFFLYFFVWEVSNRRFTGMVASLLYSLPTFRLSAATLFADSSHVLVLGLIPLVLLFYLRFLRKMTLNLAIIPVIGSAWVFIYSPFGFFALLVFLALITYSEMLLGQGRVKLAGFLLTIIITVCLTAFWYHPAYAQLILGTKRSYTLISFIWKLVPLSFFLVPIGGCFSFLIFDRKPNLQASFLAGSMSFLFLLMTYMGDQIGSDLLPIPARFMPEFILSVSFLAALTVTKILDILDNRLLLHVTKLPEKTAPLLKFGIGVFILTFLLITAILIYPSHWAIAQEDIRDIVFKPNTDHFISRIMGTLVTILTVLILVFFKIRSQKSKITHEII